MSSQITRRFATGVTLSATLALFGCGESGSSSHASGTGGAAGTGGTGGLGGTSSCSANLSSDPENCGECGRSCYGGECQAGRCGPVDIPLGIAARTDGASVTWFDTAESRMARRELNTGTEVRLCPVTSTRSVWPDGDFVRAYDLDVVSCDLATSQATTVNVGVQSVRAFTQLGSDIVFLSEQDSLVYFAARDGSKVTSVTLPPQHSPLQSATAANADSFFVMFTEYKDGTNDGEGIMRFRVGALNTPELVTLTYPSEGAKSFLWIAADATHVYATRTSNTNDVVRIDLENGATEVLAELTAGDSYGIAVGATDVYWLGFEAKKFGLYRRPKAGGAPELVTTSDGEAQDLFARNGVMTWHTLNPYTVHYMRID